MAIATGKFDTKCSEFWDKLTWSTGSITFAQFFKAMKQSGENISFTSLKTQWDIIDQDSSDDMDIEEFTSLMKKHFEATDDKVILQRAFNAIYKMICTDDDHDLLWYKTESQTPRMANKNVQVVLGSRSVKRNKAFQEALDKKLTDVFRAIDVDNSGTLEFDEMWHAVKLLQIPISYADLKLTYDFFDTDSNGHIEEDEFKRWMNSQITKHWSDDPDKNQFVALQRVVSAPDAMEILSAKGDKTFSFKEEEEKVEATNTFEKCTVADVELWNANRIADFVQWLFRDKKYNDCRDQYVAIFMTNMIDGKKFLELERKQISHLGIVTGKGKRHVSVIKNAQRHIKQRSRK